MDEKKNMVSKENRAVEKTKDIRTGVPAVNILENNDEILLHADMPGVVKDDISINFDNGTLSLSGLRKLKTKGSVAWEEFGDLEYYRSFSVPQTIDVEKISAELVNGVLKLRLPKSEAAKPRQIEIITA